MIAEQAFNDQRQAESEQQAVERIELAQMLQKKPLDQNAGGADQSGAITSAAQ